MATRTEKPTVGEDGVIRLPQTEPPAPVRLTLRQRITKIMGEIGAIPKTGTMVGQGGYKFIEYGMVAAKLQEGFAKYGIVFETYVNDVKTEPLAKGYHYLVGMSFSLVADDDPHDQIMCPSWYGEATDYSDKGLNKALTAATKTFLMKTFMVSDEDPDAAKPETEPKREAQAQARPREAQPVQAKAQAQAQAKPQTGPVESFKVERRRVAAEIRNRTGLEIIDAEAEFVPMHALDVQQAAESLTTLTDEQVVSICGGRSPVDIARSALKYNDGDGRMFSAGLYIEFKKLEDSGNLRPLAPEVEVEENLANGGARPDGAPF